VSLLILTGPAGAGKNTIASIYANMRERCAVVDVDVVRWMVLKPHVAPWAGEEGRRQHRLGVKNACALARNFLDEGFDVVVLDVLSDENAQLYKETLAPAAPRIVLLMPTLAEIRRRNRERPDTRLTDEEVADLYESQLHLHSFDSKIDNTHISAEEVARTLTHDR
jgi:adenylylsulfate kinase-like enzyme